jgi:ATP-binding cassette subfamily B protein
MMFLNKSQKYTLNYTPDTAIPSGLLAYVWMVVKRNPRMWSFQLFMDVLHGVRYSIAFYFVGQVIDLLTGLPAGTPAPEAVWTYVWLIFIVLFIGELTHALPHYWTFDWMKRARAELRSDLFSYSLQHSFTFFQNNFAGSLARKVSEGVEKALMLNEQIRWQIGLPLISMCTAGIILFQIAPLYGGLTVLFVALILAPVFLKLKKLREKSRIYADTCSAVSGQIVDSLTNMASVKSYAQEEQELAEHRRVSETQMKAWHKLLRVFLLLDNYRRITFVIYGPGMLALCLMSWQSGAITIGDMSAIMGISFGFVSNAWHLSGGVIRVTESLGYLNDSLSTLVKPHAVTDQDDAPALRVRKGDIAFDHVEFEYDAQRVFDGLHLNIPAHQRVGLIGTSGAGKSTLVNLLQRFYDVQNGQITIDGQNISGVTQASLRENIAIIPQDTALFHRSIMENIRYGKLDASDDEVIEAARRAHAFDFIEKMPEGFNTIVGERGVKLSGGQRQRIAIARAILKDAPILILDEATSALDSESEALLQASLEELMKGKTVIAVAHRLSTINKLDRLLVMQDGQIVEDGTHEALIKREGGLYSKLWTMQSGGFLSE